MCELNARCKHNVRIECSLREAFFGSSIEDPNLHISTFLRLSGTLKANQEAVRLHLFPFSLRDRDGAWFHSLTIGSITSWDQIRRVFLA